MRKIDFSRQFKDRKTLYMVLGIMIVSVFTLSIAYAFLSAYLEISGWADIASSSWDIHFANVKVKSGSVSTEPPQLTGSTSLWFNANLANQGDFYEFTVDVVNDGKIDAMVDYIYTSPELTEEQRKYLKYEVTYENGQSIESRQNLRKQSSATIKVRIEYRSDIEESDLPVMPTSLSFNITLVYIQSDGSGVDVPTGGGDEPGVGGSASVTVVSGDGSQVGDEICIGEECFYVISSTEETVTMLAKYNLYVGNIVTEISSEVDAYTQETPLENPTGIQDETAKGRNGGWIYPFIGVTQFSNDSQHGENYTDYNGSIVEGYVNNYNDYLITQGVTPIEARLITNDEFFSIASSGCTNSIEDEWSCSDAVPNWLYSTSYWTADASEYYNNTRVNCIYSGNSGFSFPAILYYDGGNCGVRPVITISRDLI